MSRQKKLFPASMTNVPDFTLPRDLETLNKFTSTPRTITDENGNSVRQSMSIQELPQGYLASGSKVTQMQYLAMRIIQTKITNPDDFANKLADFGLSSVWANATNIVQTSSACQRYLSLIRNSRLVEDIPISDPSYPGPFLTVKMDQEQITSLSSRQTQSTQPSQTTQSHRIMRSSKYTKPEGRVGKYSPRERKAKTAGLDKRRAPDEQFWDVDEEHDRPESPDEATPNAAIISLLKVLSHLVWKSRMEWTHDHAHFQAKFNEGYFNAWTDGAFRPISRDRVSAIVEAKKRSRQSRGDSILMQEAAEMVGWLLSDHDRDNNRLPKLNGQ